MPRRKQITYSQHPNRAARSAHAKGEKAFRTYDTSYIRPKRSPLPAIIGIGVLVVALIFIVVSVLNFTRGCTSVTRLPEGQTIEVTVVEGESIKSVAKTLYEDGLIANANEFTDRATSIGEDLNIHPGTYKLTGGQSIDEILAILQTPVAAETFTIPEGSTLRQTADIIAEASLGRISADDFVAAASNASVYASSYDFLAEVGEASLEGFLFPKTYPINDESTPDTLIRAMLDQFRTETASLDYSVPSAYGLSPYDTVILASIVEKESDVEHRATVASVFYNRLNWGMYLGSDATVAYFVGHDPTPEDVDTYNEYNTYLNPGLTPTPINSPSLACLQAVCNPENTNYFYFYFEDDGNGGMKYSFSETYEEHRSVFEN